MKRTIELGDDVKDRDGFEAISIVTEIPKIYVPAVEQYVPVFLKIRRKPPRYVPFEKHELVAAFAGKCVILKRDVSSPFRAAMSVLTVIPGAEKPIEISSAIAWKSANEMLESYLFLDGSPCGKLVE